MRWSGWLPIGVGEQQLDVVFDGNGNTISNLHINRTTALDDPGAVGLFGIASETSLIQGLGLVDVDVTGGLTAGALAGVSQGTVTNSYSTGSVSGKGNVGQDGRGGVGGLTGINKGLIESSHTSGTVSGHSGTGGLVGSNERKAAIRNSHSDSDVSGTDSASGGLAGANSGDVRDSHSGGTISAQDYLAGGLIGWNAGTIINSHATGNVFGDNEVGGLAGRNERLVKNSFATGAVSGKDRTGGSSARTWARLRTAMPRGR